MIQETAKISFESTTSDKYKYIGGLSQKYMKKLKKRFWVKVDKRGPKDCWPWTGAQQPRGYGNSNIRGSHVGAHCLSFELNIGPIGEGQIVAHLCDNPNCVNPRHLLAATHKFNSHDSNVKGRYGWTASWKKDLE